MAETAFQKSSITIETAERIIKAAEKKAQEMGKLMSIAVCDEDGTLKAFRRMDGAPLLSVQVAQDKAYTAISFGGMASHEWFDFVKNDVDTHSAQIDAQIKQLAHASIAPQDAALKALSIYAIDVAQLQALRPDVIFTQTQCEVCAVSERDVMRAVEHLTGIQPRVVSLAPYRLSDVWEDVLRVGQSLGRRERVETLLVGYHRRI